MAKGIDGILLYKLGRYTKAEQNIAQALEIKQRIGDSLDLAMERISFDRLTPSELTIPK